MSLSGISCVHSAKELFGKSREVFNHERSYDLAQTVNRQCTPVPFRFDLARSRGDCYCRQFSPYLMSATLPVYLYPDGEQIRSI